MKLLFVTAAVAAAALTAPAGAETYQGPYVGAQVGGKHDSYGPVDTDAGRVGIENNGDGFTGGVYAGYDFKFANRIVIGAEGGFDLGAGDRVGSRTGNGASIDPRHSFTATARTGYLVDPKTLLYVRGGYQNVDARVAYVTAPAVTMRDTHNYDGWLVGGGVERYLTDKISTRVEYRYSDLGGDGTHYHRQDALLGLSYHL